jgi:hypothetical protein
MVDVWNVKAGEGCWGGATARHHPLVQAPWCAGFNFVAQGLAPTTGTQVRFDPAWVQLKFGRFQPSIYRGLRVN